MDLFGSAADHGTSTEVTMSSGIPTGKTYLGFVLLWNAVFCVVGLLCFVLFAAGYVATGVFTILLTGYGFFRHSRSIGRRAKQALRRPTPELRRILAIDRRRDAINGSSR
jgi:hypothetical protein